MDAKWLSHFQLSATLWTVAPRLLCPWDSPGKNTEVGCQAFLTQGSNLHLLWLLYRRLFFTVEPPGKPIIYIYTHT